MAELDRPAEASVPMAVLDRFLKLSQANQEAYASMVTALDSMSSKVLDLTDQMEQVKSTIDREQLAKVVTESMQTMMDGVKALQVGATRYGDPQYNVLLVLSQNLEHDQYDKKEVQDLANALVWVLSVVAFFQKRRYTFIFMTGIALVTLLGTASEGVKSVIKLILGFLA